jgi:hypothetical protein
MELANIEKLVEKYENAATTLQEEAILKKYFTKEDVAPHLQEYKLMFAYFNTAKKDTYTKPIKLEPKKSKKRNLKWLSVAASVALLFSVFIGKHQFDEYQQRKKAEKIYADLTNGLKLLSTNLKKGEQAVATLYTVEDKVNEALK